MPYLVTTLIGVLITLGSGAQVSETDLNAFVGTWRRSNPSVSRNEFLQGLGNQASGFLK